MKELLLFCCLWYYNFHPYQAQRPAYCLGGNGAVTTHDEDIPCGKRFTINCGGNGCIRSMHHPQSCIPALFKYSDYFTVSQSPKCLVVKIFCLCRIKEAKYSCAAIGRAASTVSSIARYAIDNCQEKPHCTITVGPELDADPRCNGEQSQKRVKSILITDMVFDSVLSIFWFVGLSRTSLM